MNSPPKDFVEAFRSEFLLGIWQKFTRDATDMPAGQLTRKAVRYLSSLVVSRIYLRSCTRVGQRARCRGRPYVENAGRIEIGDDFNLTSVFVQSHLVTGPHGVMSIGNNVNINFGAAISANERLVIGSRVRIGPYVMIADSDYHSAKDRDSRPTAPIEIGDDVWLASRVIVLKGVRIGSGSVVTAGSVVSSEIPANVIAGGVPARVLRHLGNTERTETDWIDHLQDPIQRPSMVESRVVAGLATKLDDEGTVDEAVTQSVGAIIANVFQLSTPPPLSWGPAEIARWDSLGQLQLTTEIETRLGISLSERDVTQMTNVERTMRVVSRKLASQ